MPLSEAEQAQLAALQAKENEAPHRTRSGLAGVLHALVETVSGVVAHRSPEEWAGLADVVEQVAGDPPADEAPAEQPAEQAPYSPAYPPAL